MSTYEISKSSLLSLKAEILRKQEELQKARAENDVKIRTIKKNTPLEIKNKGLEQRILNDLTEEEQDILKQSRISLEAKAKLYDKLLNSKKKLSEDETEFNKRYLVQFDKKKKKVSDLPPSDDEDDVDKYPESEDDDIDGDYPADNPDEEWVEYVDCLGRTRKCLRKDLAHLKANDADLRDTVAEKNRMNNIEPPPKSPEPPVPREPSELDPNESELLSSDMRRELLRQQWEEQEEQLRRKDNIHYQDILFEEARTHGVGYYGFSKDEEERRKQQEALKKIRDETEKEQRKAQNLKKIREKQLAMRIKAAKDRKRARLGLPPEEEEPTPAEPEESEDARLAEEEARNAEELKERERKLNESRRKHIRPWDIGKDGVKKPHYEYSQEEWVDKQRRERPNEFAPPSSYSKDKKKASKRSYDHYRDYNSSKEECTPIDDELEDRLMGDFKKISKEKERERSRSGAEIPPPPTFDYYGPSGSKKAKNPKPKDNIEESIEAGLQFIRNQVEKRANASNLSEDEIM